MLCHSVGWDWMGWDEELLDRCCDLELNPSLHLSLSLSLALLLIIVWIISEQRLQHAGGSTEADILIFFFFALLEDELMITTCIIMQIKE